MARPATPFLPVGFPAPRIPSGVGRGWFGIVEALHLELLKIDPGYTVDQVKEKFGTLRYYATFPSGRLSDAEPLIDLAEEVSRRTCESCGRPGKLRRDGWWRTLCDEDEARHQSGEWDAEPEHG